MSFFPAIKNGVKKITRLTYNCAHLGNGIFGYIIYIEIYWYWSVQGGTVQHLVVQGQYDMVMFGTKWYWVSVGLLCPYILKIRRFSGMSP